MAWIAWVVSYYLMLVCYYSSLIQAAVLLMDIMIVVQFTLELSIGAIHN